MTIRISSRLKQAVKATPPYGLLLALPITGTIAMYVTFRIASLHSLLSWMLLVVATTHALAALWHHFWRRDDVLRRMIRNTK